MSEATRSAVSVANITVQIGALSSPRRPFRASERQIIEELMKLGLSEDDIKDAIIRGLEVHIIYRQGIFLVINSL